MKELNERLLSCGLNNDQICTSMQVIEAWLNNNYPIAGVLLNSWFRKELAKESQEINNMQG